MAQTRTTSLDDAPEPPSPLPTDMDHGDDLGRGLALLLRGHSERVGGVLLDGVPHGPRGYQVLVALARRHRPTQVELCQHLGIDRTVMTYLLDDLVEEGLLVRCHDPADRRVRRLVLTERGEAVVAGTCRRVRAAEDELLADLSPAERDQLRALVSRAVGDTHGVDACAVAEAAHGGSSAPAQRDPKMSARS